MWFKWQKKNTYKQYMQEKAIDINKLWQFQQSDIATGLINQSPVILQYIFVNTYETGFIGIVLLIKKIVNFITGPTAKVFLPQFSKLYKQKKIDEICDFFKIIIQLQMLFISVIAVILLGRCV